MTKTAHLPESISEARQRTTQVGVFKYEAGSEIKLSLNNVLS